MQIRNNNRTYIKVDENGVILEEYLTDIELGAPWIDVTDIPKLGGWSSSHKIYNRETHSINLKTLIELRVGSTLFEAGGDDCVCISVRGENLNPEDDVQIQINGEIHTLSMNDDILLSSELPGRYIINMDDKKYYSNPSAWVVIAEEPEENDGE